MKIFDAVYTAAVFLQLDELCDAFNADGFDCSDYSESITGENASELDILIRCCNLVLGELAESDFPLKTSAKVTCENGRVDYAEFPQKVTDIISVHKGRKKLRFDIYFDCITVPESGELTVTYAFAPSKVTLSDESPYAGNKPSARLVAYGIAREYCLISGMTDDAAMWDSRFTTCAEEEARGKKEKIVRPRAWL